MTRSSRNEAAIGRMGVDEAVSVTESPERFEAWRADFDASADWPGQRDIQVPRGDALVRLCHDYDFPPPAVHALLAQRESWDDLRIRRLGAHVQWLIGSRYTPLDYHRLGWPPAFPRAPLFYAYAALGLARRVAGQQAEGGIETDVTRATLHDIGQQVYLHQRVHGVAGMNKGWWLSHHLSHHLFRLGRLQFQRARSRHSLGPVASREPFLDVHIPEAGALDPQACDASFARAAPFFARQFADEQPRVLACTSWLLDPVLTEWLPASSNIRWFQQRFELHELRDGPSSVFEFVFDRPDLDRAERPELAGLPCTTRLQSAILDHYRRGGVIRMGVGTAAL